MRPIALLSILAVTILAVACSDSVTAPARAPRAAPTSSGHDCRSGYISGDGRYICTDSSGT